MTWWTLLYTREELKSLQSFHGDSLTLRQTVRLGLILANAWCLAKAVEFYGWYMLVMYFTSLAADITFVYLVLALIVQRGSSDSLKALKLFVFFVSIMMNVVCTSVYWGFLHQGVIRKADGHQDKIVQSYVIHSLPFASLLIDMVFLSSIQLKRAHWKVIPFCVFLIGVHNRYETMKKGEPIYPFLTWESTL